MAASVRVNGILKHLINLLNFTEQTTAKHLHHVSTNLAHGGPLSFWHYLQRTVLIRNICKIQRMSPMIRIINMATSPVA